MHQKKAKWLQRSSLNIFLKWSSYILCTHFLLGGWISYQIFKKGGLAGSQFLEGVAGKEGWLFLRGGSGCSFYIKNKLKSEILIDKKIIYKQKNVYLP